mmetsp:Transcript_84084/g.233015  ORF Transcript_84084/g.233015 Transcript_84084/m.233015 type:complete len:283 (-) Transcript_84084:75-923(-)
MVELKDRLQPVSDCNECGVGEGTDNRLLHFLLRAGVDCGRRFIEQQQWGLPEDHPCKADELPLPEAQVAALLGDLVREHAGPTLDEATEVRQVQCVPQAALRVHPEGIEVVLQGAGEEHGVLGHQAQGGPERGQAHVARVHAVEEHAAGTRLQQAQEHQQQAGLATASCPNNADLRLRLEGYADTLQDIARDVRIARLEVFNYHLSSICQPPALHLQHDHATIAIAELLHHAIYVPDDLVDANELVPGLCLSQLVTPGAKVLQRTALPTGRHEATATAGHRL